MSLLDTVVLPALSGKYEAKVKDFAEITNQNGGYVQVTLQLPDREIKYVIFPGKGDAKGRQINYVVSTLAKQFALDKQSNTLKNILEYGKEHAFNIWVSYNQTYNSINISFHEPVEETTNLFDIAGA